MSAEANAGRTLPRKDFAFISHKLGRNFSPHLALNAEKWHVRWERDFLGGH